MYASDVHTLFSSFECNFEPTYKNTRPHCVPKTEHTLAGSCELTITNKRQIKLEELPARYTSIAHMVCKKSGGRLEIWNGCFAGEYLIRVN